jgi:nucleotide-binding universal stress UspA family protein
MLKNDAMFKKILVATDGSPVSKKAVEIALGLKLQAPDAEITVLHVSEVPLRTMTEPFVEHCPRIVVLPDSTRMSMIREKDEILEEVRTIAEEMGVRVKMLNRVGDPASVIIGEAESGGYDLIVIGGEGLGKSGKILGSVASRVLNQFKGSILIIR